MDNVVFVILHYITYEDTKECINSILKNVIYDNYSIVIVDNNSNNDSLERLKSIFNYDSKIYFIKNKENLGFARGNNVGFKYAKYELNAKYIIVINNDTIITQQNFIDIILKDYSLYKFDILGPDIVSLKDNNHQNPVTNIIKDIHKLKKLIFILRILIFLNHLHLEKIYEIAIKIKRKILNKKESNFDFYCDMKKNVKLHGSCLIFSHKYISKYDGFYDKTFLYMEEDILYFICQRDNLISLYDPMLKIFHKEDSSTDAILKSDYKKRRFSYIHNYKSAKIFLKLMKL